MESENEGAAIFLFKDSELGISEKFAFNLRFYWGAGDKNVAHDGVYEFAVNGSSSTQRSFPYGVINPKRMQKRQNENSGEFVLVWQKKINYETVRASARININKFVDFLKFDVELNEIPIKKDKIGKDIVVDWSFLDDFDTGGEFFIDSNGLEMIEKRLFHRREFTYTSNNTIAANFYPITSAIAIRDHNVSTTQDS